MGELRVPAPRGDNAPCRRIESDHAPLEVDLHPGEPLEEGDTQPAHGLIVQADGTQHGQLTDQEFDIGEGPVTQGQVPLHAPDVGALFIQPFDLLPALALRPPEADALDDVAAVMLALRTRDLSAEQLATTTGIDRNKLERILDLLEVAEYVEPLGDVYAARVLVLAPEDADMVRAMLTEGREIMTAWHERNYEAIRSRLTDLTPTRNGVPFERVYTEVWQYVFAIANRTLVERGFFADPYDEGRRFRGFLPAVWARGLDELP